MRLGVLVAILVAGLMATVMVTGTLGQVVSSSGAGAGQDDSMFGCEAALGPFTGAGNGAADAKALSKEQRGNAAMIVSIGKHEKLPPLAWQTAIQASMTESTLRNLGHGDRDSLGLFQMRPSMNWGTPEQINDPAYAIKKFYDVLRGVPGWQQQRPGNSAQDVERSAFPDRYHRWESMAAVLVKHVGAVSDPTGCGKSFGDKLPPPTALAGRAISFAMGERGKPYVWGATGPDSFDCSGLMLRAFESAGVQLPRVAADQYHAGAMLPVRDAKPGDLLFWAYDPSNPVTIHHVAMYLGNNKIVEAQQTGVPVHVRSVKWTENQLVPQAVRPGTNPQPS
jgi:hypothetical protein